LLPTSGWAASSTPALAEFDPDLVVIFLGMMLAGIFLLGFFLLVFYCLSLPLRREERVRFFLDLVELGLNDRRGLERTLISIAESQEPSVGVHFHLLAAHLETGLGFADALTKVPPLVPPPIAAMLGVGGKIGDLRKVLPACRALLSDATSKTRGALNYLVVLIFVLTPAVPAVFSSLVVFVFPKFVEVVREMGATPAPLFGWVIGHRALILLSIFGATSLVYLAAFFYIGGPAVVEALGLGWCRDWLRLRVPWLRKRLQRDFSALLALLLDAEVPEVQAVTLAAEGTGNRLFVQKAAVVIDEVRRGVKLTEAIHRVDESGELRWRLGNAIHAEAGFLRA
jgi:type II secretory pathway component PulF